MSNPTRTVPSASTPRLFGAANTRGVALLVTSALPLATGQIVFFRRDSIPAGGDTATVVAFIAIDDAADPADVLATLAAQMTDAEWSALIEAAADPNTPARLAAHIRDLEDA